MLSVAHTNTRLFVSAILFLVCTVNITDSHGQSTAVPSSHAVVPPDQLESAEKMHKDLRENGIYENLEDPSDAEFVTALVAVRQARAAQIGKAMDSDELGFYDLDADESDFSKLPFKPRIISDEYLTALSKSYLLPASHTARQLHTNSIFGNLIVDEEHGVTTTLGIPNIEVAGYQGTFVYAKHPGSKWSTTLYLPVGDRFYMFQTDRKLNDALRKRFLEMAEHYVLGN